jgi:hypothetical protein
MDPASTGVSFTNHLTDANVALNRILENGSGVALGDVDGDGWCDLYFCRMEGPNVLYRNLGHWRFEDVTATAGVACDGQFSTGAVLEDVDGDGDLDLLVNGIGAGTRLFRNEGAGRFEEVRDTRLVRQFGSTSMTLADIDGDGDLDLYVGNYRTDTSKDSPPGLKVEARRVDDRIVITPENRFIPLIARSGGVEVLERGERDFLYLNDGQGRFAPISWTKGGFHDAEGRPLTEAPTDWELSVAFRDLNGDGAPDLYTCSDFAHWRDRGWWSEPGKGFRAWPSEAQRCQSVSSMSIDSADINRDGHMDFFVTDMVSRHHRLRQRQRPNLLRGLVATPMEDPAFSPEVPHNTLFLNRGDGTFAEIAQFSGVHWSEWSWSGAFLDVDLDGYEDLLVTTGNFHDVQDADTLAKLSQVRDDRPRENNLKYLRWFPRLETPCLAFRNRGDLTFQECGADWGFNRVGVSQGMAFADLDNDGDLDVVINNLNAPASLLQNRSGAPRIAVRLKGAGANRRGIGARIEVRGGPMFQSQEMISGGRYVSCDDAERVFAAGSASSLLDIDVRWRSGFVTRLKQVPANRIYEIDETGSVPPPPQQAPVSTHFEDVSDWLGHRHAEPDFDDFERQPLLPKRLSRLGPSLGWLDLDADGAEELVVGAPRGRAPAAFRRPGPGGAERLAGGPWSQVAARDMSMVVGARGSDGKLLLVGGFSNWEEGPKEGAAVVALGSGPPGPSPLLPLSASCAGPLAMADVDQDGDLDLFVGGRVIAGRYPEPADSFLLLQQAGAWEVSGTLSYPLRRAGLVSGAVFSDLDSDGQQELILACEWGSLRVFKILGTRLMERTEALGLQRWTGWWTSVTAADVDGDGRMDLVAGNWGLNNDRAAYASAGLRLTYGDFVGRGGIDMLESFQDPDSGQHVPWRDWKSITHGMPFVAELFPTHQALGEASVSAILGENVAQAREWQARCLETGVFLNRGDHFDFRALPAEAQLAPAFGIGAADFDGDGHEDLVLAQNFFGLEPDSPRQAQGRGLWLRGDGTGGFSAVPGQESGILVYGEQRACAVADFDGDGRADLALAQNNGPTKLYRNRAAPAGLRVRLRGAASNPDAVGGRWHAVFGAKPGPAHEVRAGGGFASQDAFTQVAGGREQPTAIVVRWPSGPERRYEVAKGTREIVLSPEGIVSSK